MSRKRHGQGWARAGIMLLGSFAAAPLAAQQPVTLADAIVAAQSNAPRLGLALADSAAARAGVAVARAYPDPALALGYSQSAPRHHVEIEQPIDFPWLRSARIRAAESAAGASRLTLGAERAAVRYLVELAYAEAAGAAAIEALSRQDVSNGVELVRSVRLRHDAGDVSELDVDLAEVILGQLRGVALTDSLQSITSRLRLQSLMGLPVDRVEIVIADSLVAGPVVPDSVVGGPGELRLAAARELLASQEAQLTLARRSRFGTPALRAGFEQGDESDPGLLPTLGVSIPLPFFGGSRAAVAQARAGADHARAELAVVERETRLARATAERQREVIAARLEVDRATLVSAQRVAALSLTAYREGAYPLATVLEAQRNARDSLRRFVEDLTAGRSADAAYGYATAAGGATP